MANVEIGRCMINPLLEKRGLDLVYLANRTGISKQSLSNYATGQRPSMNIKTARKIAVALNCYIDELYEWVD